MTPPPSAKTPGSWHRYAWWAVITIGMIGLIGLPFLLSALSAHAETALRGVSMGFLGNPKFDRSCFGCHGGTFPTGGFNPIAHESLFRSGKIGEPAIVPDSAKDSQ